MKGGQPQGDGREGGEGLGGERGGCRQSLGTERRDGESEIGERKRKAK